MVPLFFFVKINLCYHMESSRNVYEKGYRPISEFINLHIVLSTVLSLYQPYFQDIDRSTMNDKFRGVRLSEHIIKKPVPNQERAYLLLLKLLQHLTDHKPKGKIKIKGRHAGRKAHPLTDLIAWKHALDHFRI